jgi:hypothetical protein
MLIAGIIGEFFGTAAALVFMDYRYLATFFFVVTIPIFIFYFWIKPTFFYLLRVKDRKGFLKLLKYILRVNSVREEYIKAKLKNNRISLQEEALEASLEVALIEKSTNIELDDLQSKNKTNHLDISNYLKLTEEDLEPLFSMKEDQQQHSVSIKKYFSNCKKTLNLIAYVFLIMNLYWVKGMTIFLPERMGFKSVYLNNFLLSFADLLGISIMIFFLNNTPRSKLNKIQLSVILVSSTILSILHLSSVKSSKPTLVFDIILSCKHKSFF